MPGEERGGGATNSFSRDIIFYCYINIQLEGASSVAYHVYNLLRVSSNGSNLLYDIKCLLAWRLRCVSYPIV